MRSAASGKETGKQLAWWVSEVRLDQSVSGYVFRTTKYLLNTFPSKHWFCSLKTLLSVFNHNPCFATANPLPWQQAVMSEVGSDIFRGISRSSWWTPEQGRFIFWCQLPSTSTGKRTVSSPRCTAPDRASFLGTKMWFSIFPIISSSTVPQVLWQVNPLQIRFLGTCLLSYH